MTKDLQSPEMLRKLLRYEPQTGKLFWRERSPDMFKDGHRSKEGNCNNWNSKYAGMEACTAISKGYLIGSIFKKRLKAHRICWAIYYGQWPSCQIDHINGDRSDNRIENLRDVSPLENQRNMKKPSTNKTGHIGVYEHNGRWRVKVRNFHVGIFDSIDQAVTERLKAQLRFGFHENHGR